jgi:ribonuclease HI
MLANNHNMLHAVKIITRQHMKVFPTNEYLLRFDGCSKGNPGPSGAGAVIYQNNNEIWGKSAFVGLKSTNNEAEYMGLIIGLQEASNMKIKHLTVEGDSMIVIKQMTGDFKVKSSRLSVLYEQATVLATKFESITFTHIYRKNNARADELSNIALEIMIM